MDRTFLMTALVAGAALGASFGACAQATAAGSVQRDANQEQRIENGLRNGSITPREDALLQRDEAHVDKLQSRAMRDGTLSAADKARLNAAQDKAGRDIATATHNGVEGNPMSASSQRAQAEAQRDVNQQKRIAAGVRDGSLTKHESARLENGQARVDKAEYRAGRDGRVGAGEQTRVARAQNHQSVRIRRQRHDAQHRG
ncbi:MAG TPA: hypothetical protein VF453_12195 [Burkholderiaceae bacterium]